MMRALTIWSVVCCTGILCGITPGLATASEFRGLGQLPGGVKAYASAVSADGSVVVGRDGGLDRAWRWTAETGLQQLTGGDGDSMTSAKGVSSDGSVIVGYMGDGESREAALWTEESGVVGLGLSPDGDLSTADKVSDDGSVIVGYFGTPVGFEAFRWTAADGIEPLGVPEGFNSSLAGQVSADGSIIAVRSHLRSADGSMVDWGAWIWTEESGLEYLGQGVIHDMAPDGSVVVGSFAPSSPLDGHNFRWTRETGMAVLPFEKGHYIIAVSPDGSVIYGGYRDPGTAFMWDEETGSRDLRNVFISNYGLASALEGWQLDYVADTSRDGLTIVGRGTNPAGEREAWIAVLDPLGDMNGDGLINGLDVDPFVDVLLNGTDQNATRFRADMNSDGEVNGLDVDPFVGAVIGVGGADIANAGASVPESSTFVLATLGSLGLLGYGWRRRQRRDRYPHGVS